MIREILKILVILNSKNTICKTQEIRETAIRVIREIRVKKEHRIKNKELRLDSLKTQI